MRMETAGSSKDAGKDHAKELGKDGAAAADGGRAWVDAAVVEMAQGGVAAIRIEALARRLRVTKGGFYWHFKDRDALLLAVLDRWREGRIAAVHEVTEIKAGETPADRLARVLARHLERPNRRGLAVELAIRDWSRGDERAARTVADVDAVRQARVAALFRETGLDAAEADRRAYLFYSLVFGQALVVPPEGLAAAPDSVAETCVRLLTGMRAE